MTNRPPMTICLIDDDSIYQMITTKMIEMVNPQQKVISFFNGQQAIDYFKVLSAPFQLPDIIFLDINMPIMDGWGFLEAFTALDNIQNLVPVYMVSSSLNQEDAIRSKSFEVVQDFIIKPMSKIKITEILNKALTIPQYAGHTRNAHLPN